MRNLDFEILKSNYWNLKIFSGLRNESGPKWVGAQMGQGPNELGPKCVGAQMSRGPNESGPKWVGAQMCWGPNESGPKCAGAQMSWGPNVLGPKWVRGPNEDWAQMCPSRYFVFLKLVFTKAVHPSLYSQRPSCLNFARACFIGKICFDRKNLSKHRTAEGRQVSFLVNC